MKYLPRIFVLLFVCACTKPIAPVTTTTELAKNAALSEFMRNRLNPPFSKLSFLLFHAEENPSEELAGMLPDVSRELTQVVDVLASWQQLSGYSAQAKQVFSEYAIALNRDMKQIDASVRADRIDDARVTFDAFRRKCDACHHFFRYDEPVLDDSSDPRVTSQPTR